MGHIIARYLICLLLSFQTLVQCSSKLNNRQPSTSLNYKKNTFSEAFGSSSSDSDKEVEEVAAEAENLTEAESTPTSSDEESPEYIAVKPVHVRSAWNSANTIPGRDAGIWRLDSRNNVIIAQGISRSSPLSFSALVKLPEDGTEATFEAVQSEYYGADDEDNHANALKYNANSSEFESVLSLIEIALYGHVSNDQGESVCWCPSQIHQDIFARSDSARRWQLKVQNRPSGFGRAGHFLIFDTMGVSLKDIRNFSEHELDTNISKSDFVYVHDYQGECADSINPVTDARYADSETKYKRDVKSNWGLPVVTSFIAEEKNSFAVSKSYSAPRTTRSSTALALNEDNFPSLSSVPATKPVKVAKRAKF